MVLRALILLLLLALAAPLRAQEGWRAAQWGMTAEELQAAVPGLVPASLDYGPLAGAFVLRRAEVAGLRFRAVFQLDARGRLRQILFDRRGAELRPGDARTAYAALQAAHGPEGRLCFQPPRGGAPARIEAVWPLPEAIIHLSWLDFGPEDRLADLDAAEFRRLLRAGETEAARELARQMPPPGALSGQLPRRLLIRRREPGWPELAGDCAPPPPPRPPATARGAEGAR